MLSRTREGGDSRLIEKRTLKSGRRVYRVRWREAGRGSPEHVRSFDRRDDAVRYETDLRRRKQLMPGPGEPSSRAGRSRMQAVLVSSMLDDAQRRCSVCGAH